jgi:subtilisin-like proprotein convertase family protein
MKMNKNSYTMKMNMNSMQYRGVAWIFSGLALVMMLFMMGMPAFGQYSLPDSTGAITINNDTVSGGQAKNGYPSLVTVPANVAGNLEKVTVTLNGFTHAYPNDVVLLLVGPNGFAVPLMGNDGGGVSVTGLTLTFDDVVAGAGTLSTATAISSGTNMSGDNSAFGTTEPFPAPAPTNIIHKTSLTAFGGLTPADYIGQWSLYVLDDSQPNTGSIASWSLNLYTKPVIAVTNTSVTINENQSAVFNFSASDTTSNATLSASINLSGVTTGDIGYTNSSGAFADFISYPADFQFSPTINPNGPSTVTITPNADLWGTATFTITLKDGYGFTTTSSNISLTVSNVAVAPAISLASTTITTSNGLATATNLISLVSLDGHPGSGLVLSVVATNGAGAGGVNLGNVGVNSNVFTSIAGLPTPQYVGRTNNFYFSIVPGGFPVGTSYLNFIVTDTGNNLSTTVPVAVVVDPLTNGPFAGPLVYASTNSLTLAATTHGALSTISITNLTGLGLIGKVTVSVLGLTNINPSGLALGLQAPNGTVVPLIKNPTGGSNPSTYAELTFADNDGLLNVQGSGVLPAGTILTNYVLEATAGPSALADALGGRSPTNTGATNVWTLFVTNTSTAELGISGGWVLDFYPAPLVQAAVQTITMPESATTNVVFVTSDIVGSQSSAPTVTLNPSITLNYSSNALAAASVSTSGSATINGTNYTTNVLTLTGNYNEEGTATVTVSVTETNGLPGTTPSTFKANDSVTLTVQFVPQPPTIGFIENQVTAAGQAILNVPFVISSPDTDATNLIITVGSGNQGLLPTTSAFQNNVVVTRGPSSGSPPPSPSVETNYLSLFPIGTKASQSVITITVTDATDTNAVSTSFLLVVGQPASPLYDNPSSINITNTNNSFSSATGAPYPSTNVVTGLVGTVENVAVTVFDVTEGHNNAAGLNLLLVGPTNAAGQSPAVYLMGGAGTNTGLLSANLIFSNSVPGFGSEPPPIPQNGQISSSTIYSPTNYRTGAYTTAAPTNAPAPGGTGYGTNLVSSFRGINPNGTWSLYAFDPNGNQAGDGFIVGGWQLSIITAPNVSPPTTNYSTLENIPTNIVIPVGDAETSLTVTAVVTPSGLSSASSITIQSPVQVTNTGTANLAVLDVVPNLYQFGTNNIHVTATDANGNSSSANLQFTVIYSPQPPIILVTNVTASTPAAVPLSPAILFAVWDPQTTNANTFTVKSTGLIPAPIVTITTNGSAVNGTNSYSLNFQPVGVGTGTAVITVTVQDGVGQTAQTTFTVTVTPNLVFASTNSITLGPGYPAYDLASAYPWGITVPTNEGGLVTGVTVNLVGFTHNDASDVDVLLVSPDGQHSVVLMANAGNQDAANNVNLEFSQSAAKLIPQFTDLTSGSYRPTNYLSSLVFSNPAPASGYSENLTTAFAGLQPSGTWNLYVMDLGYFDSGSISNWILFITTGPGIGSIPNYTVLENGSVDVPVALTDFSTAVSNLTVTVTNSSGGYLLTNNSAPLAVKQQGIASLSGVTNLVITPEPNYPSAYESGNSNSTNLITVTVSDGSGNKASTTFTLIVQYVPQPPVIVSVSTTNLLIAENGSGTITFTVSDVDSYLTGASVNLTSTNPALLLSSGIATNSTFASLAPGNNGTVTYNITPLANVFGTNQGVLVFSVMNTNNQTTTTSIPLSVSHVIQAPTLAVSAGPYGLYPGTTTNIPFSVSTLESGGTMTITALSSNPSEVPNSPNNIVITPASFTNLVPGTYTGNIEIIIPSGTPSGSSTIWVTNTQVVAGTTNTESPIASFTINVLRSPTTVFANTAPIANSGANGEAVPYPSTNEVSGLQGGVFSAAVTLNALSASVPNDVSILLEGPDGTSVLLLSDAGGTTAAANVTLTFADTNMPAPANAPLALNGGSAGYHPTGYNGNTNALPTNAPPPPYFDRMAVFNGRSPNGTWSLWVVDNTTGDTVSIANGWALSIATAPEIALDTPPVPAIPENAVGQNNQETVNFHVIDSTGSAANDTISVTCAPSALLRSISVSGPSGSGASNDYTATLTPATFQTGTGTLTFTVTRTDGASDTANYAVTVTKSNMPPTVTRFVPMTINENQSGQTEFFVTQLGDPLSTVTVAAFSSDPTIVANSGLTFDTGLTTANPGTLFNNNVVNLSNFASSVPNAGDLILNVSPVLNAVGTCQIFVYVTNDDGAPVNNPSVVATNFLLTVNPATFSPTFTNVPQSPVSVTGGNTTNISFQVLSLDHTPPSIIVSAINLSAPNGVTVSPAFSTNVAGSTWTVVITTAGQVTNLVKSTIQLIATDSHGLSATNFFQVNTVPDQQRYYNNTNPINIVDVSPSIPSPSPINVSGLVGLISQVVVNINGFGHQYPSDVGMLLVGPNGSNTVLMNNAGDGVPVSGLTLAFTENATGPAPVSSVLTSTSYLPSDWYPVKPYNFERSGINNPTPPNPPPPNGPYPTNLNVFNGLNPNATWYLYVQDDSPGEVGNITGGWTLQIFTQPLIQITGLTNIPVTYPLGGKTAFVILDDSLTSYTSTSFGVTSGNSALIPPASVTFTSVGTATNWQVSFTPALNVAGSSLITIYATNSYGQVSSASFEVTVTPVNIPPVVLPPPAGSVITITAGTPTTIALNYYDTGYATNALIVSATSSPLGSENPVPASSLAFVGNGVGASNLVVTPVGNLTGSNLITITATQPVVGGTSGSGTFVLVVAPSVVPFSVNTNTITINAGSQATPYPSQITVSGVGANILNLTATLIGFSHTFPSDVSALLVGPQGQNVMLMSGAGDGIGVSNLRLTFDDSGTAMSANGALTNGTYAPALSDLTFIDKSADITNFSPPVNPPYGHTMSVFTNTRPNGVWSLYVFDNNEPDTGVISGGWTLSIETIGPMITPLSPVTINENTTATIPFSVFSEYTSASNVTVTASASGEVPASLVSSLVINGQGATNETLTITPTPNYPSAVTNTNGTATITLVLTDANNNSSTNSFQLTVLYEDIAPTINLPAAQTTPANVPLAVPFTISDVQGTSALAVSASVATNDGTVNVTTNGGGSYTLTFTPNETTNVAIVTIVAGDGTVSSTNTLQITVTAGLAPAVTIVSATNTPENSTISVPFTVANVPPTFSVSNIIGVASNSALVASVTITGAGTNFAALITLVPYANGSSAITISARDQYGIGTASMTLSVTPVEYPPVLAPIADTNTTENTPVNVVLNVTDVATSITNLLYSASISSSNVIGAVNFSFNGTNEIATIVPATNKTGVSAITITVGDGVASVYQVFAVTVNTLARPTMSATLANGTLKITFAGTPGASYNIQSSSDLKNWATVATVTANAVTGAAEYDVTISNHGTVFYRAAGQ